MRVDHLLSNSPLLQKNHVKIILVSAYFRTFHSGSDIYMDIWLIRILDIWLIRIFVRN